MSAVRRAVPKLLVAGLAACPAILLGPASAADDAGRVDEVLQELFLGEPAYPQDALELQVTSVLGGAQTGDTTTAGARLRVELGLTDRFQIAAEAPYAWVSAPPPMARRTGVGSAELEAMYTPLNDRRLGAAVSAGLELAFPSVSAAGKDSWSVEAFATAYKVLGRVHANLTVSAALALPTAARAEHERSLDAAVGVFTPLGAWVPVLELAASSSADPSAVLSAGTLWHPTDDLELGAAVQLGLDRRSIGGLVVATMEIPLAHAPAHRRPHE